MLRFDGTATARYTANAATGGGAVTIIAVLRRLTDSIGSVAFAVTAETSGAAVSAGMGWSATTDILRYQASSVRVASTMTAKVADGWVAIAGTKVSGATTPRFHKHVYSTGVSTHENATSAGNATTGVGAGGVVRVHNAGPGDNAVYAAVAVYDRVLSDVEFEGVVVNLNTLKASSPAHGLWVFDGDALTTGMEEFFSGSAFSTGTASSVDGDGCPFSWGHGVVQNI